MTDPALVIYDMVAKELYGTAASSLFTPCGIENGLITVRIRLVIPECCGTRNELENVASVIYKKLNLPMVKTVFDTAMEDQKTTDMKYIKESVVPLLCREIFIRYRPIDVDVIYPVKERHGHSCSNVN